MACAAACAPAAPEQRWSWAADGRLSLPGAFGGALRLQQLTAGGLSLYAKPLLGGQLALAVLNRAATPLAGGATIDLVALGFAPATRVTVRDVWAASTSAPLAGSFTTRAIDSHETLLLRIELA